MPSTFPPLQQVELPNGQTVAYREWGLPFATKPVVLVHGITSSGLGWDRVARALGLQYKVYAVDLRGHGDSSKPESGYLLADMAEDVLQFIDGMGLVMPHLIGHSLGGGVAGLIGAVPGVLDRLVLEDPALVKARRPEVEADYETRVEISAEAAREMFAPNLAKGWTEADLDARVDASVKARKRVIRAIFRESADIAFTNVREALPRITYPTLMIRARTVNGGIVDHEAVGIAEANPNIRVVTHPTADHGIHRTAFDDFMAEVEPFLEGAERA
jgi:pimeloyl-ACP methyl ester carboxylesterase